MLEAFVELTWNDPAATDNRHKSHKLMFKSSKILNSFFKFASVTR